MKHQSVCSLCGNSHSPSDQACPHCLLAAGLDFDTGHKSSRDCLLELPEDPEGASSDSSTAELENGNSPNWIEPGGQIGAYKLLEQIGEGGFGVVYMAEQQVPVRRHVALKVLKLGL